jgi:Aerotolerance regulator N-terminal/von Willebrand factor type A domain
MLSFLSPLYLAGLAAAAIPVVLHLLKREPEPRLKFAAVRMLKNAPIEHTRKRHLREWLLLALRVAALTLLAVAFARPFLASGAAVRSVDATIVAVDRSMSLSAPGRFERAKQLAVDAIDRAPAGRLVGIVAFDDDATIVVRPTADRAEARAAVQALQAGDGGTRYRAGLSAAVQALDGLPGSIVVVTDLQASGWGTGDRATVPASVKVEVSDVGPPPTNLAVTDLAVDGDRLVATVRNSGDTARQTVVSLAVDGKSHGDQRVAVAPHAATDVTFDLPRDAGTAAVSVDDPDGIAADNTRYRVLAGAAGLEVVLVTADGAPARDAFYVNQALAASAPGTTPFDIVGVSGAGLADWDQARLDRAAAVMLLSTRGLEPRGRARLAAYVRGGGGVLVAAGPDVDADVLADALGTSTPVELAPVDPAREGGPRALAPVDVRHPIFRAFGTGAPTLGLVTFRQIVRISGGGCRAIAQFTTSEPALVECPAGQGRVLVLASDLENGWNDFPRRATFVPFLQEAVRYLASDRPEGGSFLVATAPADVPRVPGIANWPEGSTPGRVRRVAVNVDPRESDADRLSTDEFMASVTPVAAAPRPVVTSEAREQEERQRLWQYGLVLMLVVLAAEGFVAARTA